MGSSLLDKVLRPDALRATFQPVFDETRAGWPHYMEGLIRGPQGTNAERPDILFEYARRKRSEPEVDRACVRAVLLAARWLPIGVSIGINVHTATLAADLEFLNYLGDLLTETYIAPEHIVVELLEHGQPWNQDAFLLSVEGLRSIGARIALDDFGTGQANYRMLLECRPDYLKVDRGLVHGCHADPRRQAFLDHLAALADRIGARVVAEGIEQPEDLARVREAGIGLLQGYLLGKPAPAQTWTPLLCA
jgi:EAL domain-containing protein (putative c-di-GMP-specific phosphodiesterase class I)